MRILIMMALALALAAACIFAILSIGAALAKTTQDVTEIGPMQSGAIPKVAFVLLWVLIFGISFGWIGTI